jgi:hypothetical protein
VWETPASLATSRRVGISLTFNLLIAPILAQP